MKVSIFIRSYKKDFCWLVYCLKSIQKFCTGFHDIIIVVPEEDKELIDGFGLTQEKVFFCKERGNGYLEQQISKLRAYEYSDADYILFVDSDVIFLQPTTPEDFFLEEPLIYKTNYIHIPKYAYFWKAITEKVVGHIVDFEYMRRLPLIYRSDTLRNFVKYMDNLHGSMDEYILNQPGKEFSEFNALGWYCDKFENEKYSFLESPPHKPDKIVNQYWSYSNISNEERKEMEEILQ